MKIRIRFQKTGHLKYIGHLDVMRTFQKVMRRAGIDILYSAGFSPHQKMTFATPLSLGAASRSEYMDIEVGTLIPKEELLQKINAVNVPELRCLDASLLPDDAKNAMSLLAQADYEVSFRPGHAPSDEEAFFDGLIRFYDVPERKIVKNTKKNEVEVDLTKQIHELKRIGNGVFMKVDTGSASNLKPELVFSTYADHLGIPFEASDIQAVRTELYGEKDGRIVPLLDFGETF